MVMAFLGMDGFGDGLENVVVLNVRGLMRVLGDC